MVGSFQLVMYHIKMNAQENMARFLPLCKISLAITLVTISLLFIVCQGKEYIHTEDGRSMNENVKPVKRLLRNNPKSHLFSTFLCVLTHLGKTHGQSRCVYLVQATETFQMAANLLLVMYRVFE